MKIIIDDVKIEWDDSNKSLKDIVDMMLVFLYGNLKQVATDNDSIQKRSKRLNRKLNRLCKKCGVKLGPEDIYKFFGIKKDATEKIFKKIKKCLTFRKKRLR